MNGLKDPHRLLYLAIAAWIGIFVFLWVNQIDNLEFLFPLLVIIPIICWIKPLLHVVKSNLKIALLQCFLSFAYFIYHAKDILKLELWSDEILSLTIAANRFHDIAKQALTLGAFPPYYYWELSIWQKIAQQTPPYLTEFIYRVPSMIYHTCGAIVFSWIIGIVIKNMSAQDRTSSFYRWLAFFAYFFNPLLFTFALQVRPYAFIAFGSVIFLTILLLEKTDSYVNIPIQLFFSIVSFSFILSYIPVGFANLFKKKSVKVTCILFATLLLIYGLMSVSAVMPNQTVSAITLKAINGTLRDIRSVFFPSIIQICMFLIVFLFVFKKKTYTQLLFQGAFLMFTIPLLAYVIRYQTFATRHLDIVFPLILALLFIVAERYSPSIKILWALLILLFFIVPWFKNTQSLFLNQAYESYVSIGIKQAVLNATKEKRNIYLDINDQKPSSRMYYTDTYFEEQSSWYINRYVGHRPLRMNAASICHSRLLYTVYFISFRNVPCFQDNSHVSVLHVTIHDI